MTAREDLPSIAESQATGEVAQLYAEIRETLGLPVVNLIWRHFATIDGGLAWAWKTLAPLYASGAAQDAGARLVAGLKLPLLATIPRPVLAGAGIDDDAAPVLAAILDTYNRGNALNLCALSVLLVDPSPTLIQPARDPVPPLPRPAAPVPAVAPLESFSGPVQALVWQMNQLGQPAASRDMVLATLYKHLAPWPGFLSLAWGLLAPLDREGVLHRLARDASASARIQAALLAEGLDTVAPSPASHAVHAAAAHFATHVIGRMIPIAQLLRRAIPEG